MVCHPNIPPAPEMPASFRPSSPRRPSSTPVMTLPNELLAEIVQHIPARHASNGYVVDLQALAAFSSVSRIMRAVAIPYLYREVPITSERQLRALRTVPPHLLQYTQCVAPH